jgi:tocopherol cyclase
VKSLYKIFHPEVFQGSLRKSNYFEGWYFKHVSGNEDDAFAVIPGVSLSGDSHSFVQFVDGKTGISHYFRYKISDFKFDKKRFRIGIGKSNFSSSGIDLDLSNETIKVSGRIEYTDILQIPSGILSPGIMGWYSFVPTMECNHGIVSVSHNMNGSLTVNGESRPYAMGKGYIEKDWGVSFPESWLWLQCNNFPSSTASVMISIAKIPWRKRFFIGFIAFVSMNGKTTVLATYNGARVESLRRLDLYKTEISISKGDLSVSAIVTKKGGYALKAPVDGAMKNIIKESLDSEADLKIIKSGQTLFAEKGIFAGYEETDAIFSYF